MRFVSRLLFILWTVWRFGLDDLALSGLTRRRFQILRRATRFGRRWREPRGVRLRLALEGLGPIFVKFGQVLSTRRDLLPEDVALELAKLQDRVPPFPAALSRELVERAFGRPLEDLFASFEAEPVASASRYWRASSSTSSARWKAASKRGPVAMRPWLASRQAWRPCSAARASMPLAASSGMFHTPLKKPMV